jgi:hypothetical protein
VSPFLQLYFWTRRASMRSAAVGRLLAKLALLAGAVFLAVLVGQGLVVAVVVAIALVVLVFVLGRFSAEWRNAGVTVGRQYRRLTRRGGRR